MAVPCSTHQLNAILSAVKPFDDLAREHRTADAVRQGDAGMCQAHENEVAIQPKFTERAGALILQALREKSPRSGEELTDYCRRHGIGSHDDRCFGAVYRTLKGSKNRKPMIVRVGDCQRMKGHGTGGGSVYALAEDRTN